MFLQHIVVNKDFNFHNEGALARLQRKATSDEFEPAKRLVSGMSKETKEKYGLSENKIEEYLRKVEVLQKDGATFGELRALVYSYNIGIEFDKKFGIAEIVNTYDSFPNTKDNEIEVVILSNGTVKIKDKNGTQKYESIDAAGKYIQEKYGLETFNEFMRWVDASFKLYNKKILDQLSMSVVKPTIYGAIQTSQQIERNKNENRENRENDLKIAQEQLHERKKDKNEFFV